MSLDRTANVDGTTGIASLDCRSPGFCAAVDTYDHMLTFVYPLRGPAS